MSGFKHELRSPESSDTFGHVQETDKNVCCNRESFQGHKSGLRTVSPCEGSCLCGFLSPLSPCIYHIRDFVRALKGKDRHRIYGKTILLQPYEN